MLLVFQCTHPRIHITLPYLACNVATSAATSHLAIPGADFFYDEAACHSRTAFRHPWRDSPATSGGDAARPSPTTRGAIDCGLSDVSELSEFP